MSILNSKDTPAVDFQIYIISPENVANPDLGNILYCKLIN